MSGVSVYTWHRHCEVIGSRVVRRDTTRFTPASLMRFRWVQVTTCVTAYVTSIRSNGLEYIYYVMPDCFFIFFKHSFLQRDKDTEMFRLLIYVRRLLQPCASVLLSIVFTPFWKTSTADRYVPVTSLSGMLKGWSYKIRLQASTGRFTEWIIVCLGGFQNDCSCNHAKYKQSTSIMNRCQLYIESKTCQKHFT